MRNHGHFRTDEAAHLLCERIIDTKSHRHPGYGLGCPDRRQEKLIHPLAEHPKHRRIAMHTRLVDQPLERQALFGRCCGCEHLAVKIGQEHPVGANAA